MISSDLNTHGFTIWTELKSNWNYNKSLILGLPRQKGVYVIRLTRPVIRIKGQSDIIYIGHGTIQSRIQALLRSYLPYSYRGYQNAHSAREEYERVVKELNTKSEFSYVLTQNSKQLEQDLLIKYCSDHIEPPPLNNTRR